MVRSIIGNFIRTWTETMAWSKQVETVLSDGLSLHQWGVNNWALTKDQAMEKLEQFERIKIPILGGDIYELVNGEPKSNDDNWYCNRNHGEDDNEFVERSINRARNYINTYRNPTGLEVLFVLVPG